MQQILKQQIQTKQQLSIHQRMIKALKILQVPFEELNQFLQDEIENNPVLEISYSKQKNRKVPHSTPYKVSSFRSLLEQARIHFSSKKELKIAELVIGNLDENGFFSAHAELLETAKKSDIEKVISIIQDFEPKGIGTKNIQDFLRFQLKKKKSLGLKIIDQYYDDFLHFRLKELQKKLKLPLYLIQKCIEKEIKPLKLYPITPLENEINNHIFADIHITKKAKRWIIESNIDQLPSFSINKIYQKTGSFHRLEKQYIQKKIKEGFWLKQAVLQRDFFLKKITRYIIKKQKGYFENRSSLTPLTIKEIAKHLHVHPSTILRAISYKYINFEGTLLSIRSLFSKKVSSNSDEISQDRAERLIIKWIKQEMQTKPLSDLAIQKQLEKKGISIARRTVTKYRRKLKIASSAIRKRHYLK